MEVIYITSMGILSLFVMRTTVKFFTNDRMGAYIEYALEAIIFVLASILFAINT